MAWTKRTKARASTGFLEATGFLAGGGFLVKENQWTKKTKATGTWTKITKATP